MDNPPGFPDAGRRILRFLSRGPASVRPASAHGTVLLEAQGRGAVAVAGDVLAQLAARGVVARSTHSIALSVHGATLAKILSAKGEAVQDRYRDIDLIETETPAGPALVLANMAESPLAQLVRRRNKTGQPFLTQTEFQAGERLRADYTRGQIMPRLGANWIATVASSRRSGAGGAAELTDAALAARQRVENAAEAVGPELSGVLIDVCCFLKGLERVEMERGWPVRSAKIVLKTALAALARHYFPLEVQSSRCASRVLHWGSADFRPTIA